MEEDEFKPIYAWLSIIAVVCIFGMVIGCLIITVINSDEVHEHELERPIDFKSIVIMGQSHYDQYIVYINSDDQMTMCTYNSSGEVHEIYTLKKELEN